jgi:hypothetical protein
MVKMDDICFHNLKIYFAVFLGFFICRVLFFTECFLTLGKIIFECRKRYSAKNALSIKYLSSVKWSLRTSPVACAWPFNIRAQASWVYIFETHIVRTQRGTRWSRREIVLLHADPSVSVHARRVVSINRRVLPSSSSSTSPLLGRRAYSWLRCLLIFGLGPPYA